MQPEEWRKKRLAELRERQTPAPTATENDPGSNEDRLSVALRSVLDENAYARLTNIRIVNPDRYQRLAQSLLYAIQNARIERRVSDAELKKMIANALPKERPIQIKRIQKRDNYG